MIEALKEVIESAIWAADHGARTGIMAVMWVGGCFLGIMCLSFIFGIMTFIAGMVKGIINRIKNWLMIRQFDRAQRKVREKVLRENT